MISKISTRALVLGAVLLGLGHAPVFAAPVGDGQPGTDITDPSTSNEVAEGGDADNGYSHHPEGFDGGDGGDITVVSHGGGSSNVTPPEGVEFTSQGGDGGQGYVGRPYQPGDDMDSNECIESPSSCSPPVQAIAPGDGGDGGNGGNVQVALSEGTVNGNLKASSVGGKAGEPGSDITTNAVGGNGGDVTITVEADSEVIGAVIAKSLGGDGEHDGHGGKIEVTISGDVAGDGETGVWAKSDGGEIHVLIDGAKVTGTISADSSNGTKELSFKFDVSDKDEFNAATTALSGPASHGTVTINGHPYEWFGFSTLVNLLTYVGKEDEVKVVVESPSVATVNEAPQSAPVVEQPKAPAQVVMVFGNIPLITGQPEMAKCTGSSEVRTVRQDDGSIVVIYHRRGEDTLIGQLKDGTFNRSQEGQDWDVKVGSEGKSVDVTNGGNSVSSCSFS